MAAASDWGETAIFDNACERDANRKEQRLDKDSLLGVHPREPRCANVDAKARRIREDVADLVHNCRERGALMIELHGHVRVLRPVPWEDEANPEFSVLFFRLPEDDLVFISRDSDGAPRWPNL